MSRSSVRNLGYGKHTYMRFSKTMEAGEKLLLMTKPRTSTERSCLVIAHSAITLTHYRSLMTKTRTLQQGLFPRSSGSNDIQSRASNKSISFSKGVKTSKSMITINAQRLLGFSVA